MDPRTPPRPSAWRALGATAACAASATGLARLAATAALGAPAPDALVGAAVLCLGALAASALAAGCALLAATALASGFGRRWSRVEAAAVRLVPSTLRRALMVGVGASISLGLGPAALADEVDVGWEVTTPAAAGAHLDPAGTGEPADVVLAGAGQVIAPRQVPETPASTGPAGAPEPEAAAAAATEPAQTQTQTRTVQDGDSLWAITEELVPAGATDADVAAAWPRLYAANLDVVGPDPGLIHPGQVLTLPPGVSA